MSARGRIATYLVPALVITAFAVFVFSEAVQEVTLTSLFPGEPEHIYARSGLPQLLREHIVLVVVSSVAATLVGISLGVFVTRPPGRDFLSVVQDLSSLAQTFPPVAVLALAVPAVGFGFRPTVVALFIYSILPVLNNTISGMEGIPDELTDASRGIGMTKLQILFLSELPLAARVIAAGVRTSVIINIGTATVGAVVGAGGLGVIIIGGLVRDNVAFVFSGAMTAALFALIVDWVFSRVESLFFAPRARQEGP
ncbi:MAG: ABC transporter permease subunit [Spirochaetes bacterium]|jgi:osmoprotectant transport system permease protein|nr:ABC transporter permease subunit [Spirochaetota bacterium]